MLMGGTAAALGGCRGLTGTGYIDVSTLYPPYAYLGLLVNGIPVGFNGSPFTLDDRPPRFHPLEFCGVSTTRSVSCDEIRLGLDSGYILTIFVEPGTAIRQDRRPPQH